MKSLRAEQYVGMNVRHHREQLGMSQDQLGRRIAAYLGKSWTRQAVSDAERGGRAYTAAELVALARLLGTTPMRLITPPLTLEEIELPARTISAAGIGDLGTTDQTLTEALAALEALTDALRTAEQDAEVIQRYAARQAKSNSEVLIAAATLSNRIYCAMLNSMRYQANLESE